MPLLEVRNLKVYYDLPQGRVKAVDGVSFTVEKGEILGVAGESGSGKSTLAHAIIGLIKPPGRVVEGEIIFEGRNLLELDEEELRSIRGREITMVFQDPNTYLNPVLRIGIQVGEVYEAHLGIEPRKAIDRVIDLLRRVRLTDPERRVAIALKPKLIILDEPTSALDVTIQAEIMELLMEMRDELGAAMIFISHDLELLGQVSDRLMIMYGGKLVEIGDTEEIFRDPLHPYTEALINAIKYVRKSELPTLEGEPPSLLRPPPGCRFHPRCPKRIDRCRLEEPGEYIIRGRRVSCLLYEEE